MKKVKADKIWAVSDVLSTTTAACRSLSDKYGSNKLSGENLKMLTERCEVLHKYCKEAGLEISTLMSGELLERLHDESPPTLTEYGQEIEAITSTVRHGLSLQSFYQIQPDLVKYYDGACALFGERVAASFPSSQFDLEEAGRSLAAGRSTACVFHLMRAITPVLKAVASELGFDEQRDWGRYLSEMKNKIWSKYPDNKTPENDAQREFFSEMEAQLRAYKEAYRNPIMHSPDKVYTEEKAEEIFGYVRAFLKKAAEKLKEQA